MSALSKSRLLDLVWEEIERRLAGMPEGFQPGKGLRLLEVRGKEAVVQGEKNEALERWLLQALQEFFPAVERVVFQTPTSPPTASGSLLQRIARTPHNRFAVELLEHLLPRKGKPLYNPLVFWGPPGVGKTTVILAYAHTLQHEGVPVLYWTAESFMQDAVAALREKRLRLWHSEVTRNRVIVLENLDAIARGSGFFQSEVLTLLEESRAQSQWIFTLSRHPRKFAKIRDDLRSRLLGGLAVHLPAPDQDSRKAFVDFLLARRQRTLPPDLLNLLVARAPGDLRVLEGWINQVLAYQDLQGRLPDPATLEGEVLLDKPSPAHTVIAVVGEVLSVYPDGMLGRSRRRNVALARRIAMHLLHTDLNLSLREIGELFHRHHTTVLSNLRTLEREQAQDSRVEALIQKVRRLLDGDGT